MGVKQPVTEKYSKKIRCNFMVMISMKHLFVFIWSTFFFFASPFALSSFSIWKLQTRTTLCQLSGERNSASKSLNPHRSQMEILVSIFPYSCKNCTFSEATTSTNKPEPQDSHPSLPWVTNLSVNTFHRVRKLWKWSTRLHGYRKWVQLSY